MDNGGGVRAATRRRDGGVLGEDGVDGMKEAGNDGWWRWRGLGPQLVGVRPCRRLAVIDVGHDEIVVAGGGLEFLG